MSVDPLQGPLTYDELYSEEPLSQPVTPSQPGTPSPLPSVGSVLDRLAAFVKRFVAFASDHQLCAVVLWIAHTHAFEAAECSPRLAIQSAEKQSGKTRLLEVLELTTREPRQVVNMSEAALFRVIEAGTPTVLWDEIDAVFGPKARDREDLRAMLNAGYRAGATVERCVGEGSKLEVKPFRVFCPVALAGIGQLPDTVQDRSIVIRLRRRRIDEPIDKLRRRRVEPEAAELRSDLAAVLERVTEQLADLSPELPPGLPDRAEDVWEPLVAIADLAGWDWPQAAREAALNLTLEDRDDEGSLAVRLLADIRAVLGDDKTIPSEELCPRLAAVEESPWGAWRGNRIEPRGLAGLLRPYGIKSRQLWVTGGKNVRGYRADDFADAFARYLPVPARTARALEPLEPNASNGNGSSGPNGLAASAERAGDLGARVSASDVFEVATTQLAHDRARERTAEAFD
jgi:hypothetical protein